MIEINLNEMTAEQAKNKPKTLEELFVEQFLDMKENAENTAKAWLTEKKERERLQTILNTFKKHATLDKGTVCIIISEYQKEDRDIIVKALKLKEEEKPNE